MSNPIVIQGFPVPPSPVSMWNGLTQKAPLTEIEIYTLQSIGYRAWMDEAARIGMDLKELYDGTGHDFYVRQNTLIAAQKLAVVNAEACRTWMPKGEI